METSLLSAPEQEIIDPLERLINKLELQKLETKDMIVPSGKISYSNGKIWVQEKGFDNLVEYDPTEIFHMQCALKLDIPKKYYDRMLLTAPDILEKNINGWLSKKERVRYMLRTWNRPEAGNIARAFLSNSYAILDNYDVLFAALDAIKQMKVNVKILKAEVTEKRMYLHVGCPDIELDASAFLKEYLKENDGLGNGIISGLIITNSEVGLGTFEVRPRATIIKCNNGLIGIDDKFRRVHLGARMDEGEIQWSEKTKNANYNLVISQTQDAVKKYLSKEYLGVMIEKIADAHNIKLEYPVDTVEYICKELSVDKEHRKNIMSYFLKDNDHTVGGVVQAVTREAQNMSPDTQYDVENDIFTMLPKIKGFDRPFSKS